MRIVKKFFKKYKYFIIIILFLSAFFIGAQVINREKNSYKTAIENNYNMAFYQLVDNMQDVEVYLAKSIISNSPDNGAETLTYVWREANLAQTYLSMLPLNSAELENTAKFLNQVSDYSYFLSKKTFDDQQLTQEDLNNLEQLHNYSRDLKNTLNQLSVDLNDGKISWRELAETQNPTWSKEASNISKESFGFVEENFHEYAGLIYDGAFSEHMSNPEHRGLTGSEIQEHEAKNIVTELFKNKKIRSINMEGTTDHASIKAYSYTVNLDDNSTWWVSVSKQGGHLVSINSNRNVESENIDEKTATEIAEKYLNDAGYISMVKTYYSKNGGIETINFAYTQDGVIIYPDLIKVKVALDNGEVLGIETTGYLNSHTVRAFPDVVITKEQAIEKINTKLNIENIRLAIIPTEFQTEIPCWEIKGRVDDREFLVYINVETGKEEDILVILNSAEGTVTM